MRLVLATYNIHRCVGWDGRYDPGRIRDVIHELDADIVALQEVDSPDRHGLELAQWLGAESKLKVVAGPTLLERRGHHGNAVLTRCAYGDIRLVDLSLPGYEPRGAIDMDVTCDGTLVQLIATHLGLFPWERRLQVRRLLKRVGPNCVLMGDLNEWMLWGGPLRWIKAMFGHTPALRTFPSFRPLLPLDRIWVRPRAMRLRMSVHRTRLSARASDHLPLKAVIEWASPPHPPLSPAGRG
ncbi:Endonuclease/exonuclease/phosphatase [Nitrospira moscoviensis]|uniref:Endonuclease/exonuclease/phosphatase n=1 Tax=Nitrospira moscoviensis TaxID=42253 RepID=A0A0K2GDH5_NITMO|nr:Endonuclease/exonuclease/phosphatase [Nitrospira moscoviensis]